LIEITQENKMFKLNLDREKETGYEGSGRICRISLTAYLSKKLFSKVF